MNITVQEKPHSFARTLRTAGQENSGATCMHLWRNSCITAINLSISEEQPHASWNQHGPELPQITPQTDLQQRTTPFHDMLNRVLNVDALCSTGRLDAALQCRHARLVATRDNSGMITNLHANVPLFFPTLSRTVLNNPVPFSSSHRYPKPQRQGEQPTRNTKTRYQKCS